jgi:hypothetical protein
VTPAQVYAFDAALAAKQRTGYNSRLC